MKCMYRHANCFLMNDCIFSTKVHLRLSLATLQLQKGLRGHAVIVFLQKMMLVCIFEHMLHLFFYVEFFEARNYTLQTWCIYT